MILKNNQHLANKIGENIDMEMDFNIGPIKKKQLRNVLNIVINIRDN